MTRQLRGATLLMAAGIASIVTVKALAQVPGTLSAADKKFVMAAAQGGLAEVQLGELASKQGSSDKVKEFGQKMVDDHGKANDDLKSVAANKGLTLPGEPNAAQKATLARLSKLHGAAFDSAYLKEMKMDHKNDLAAFKKESSAGQDNEVKGFASRTLPVVQSHYEMLTKM